MGMDRFTTPLLRRVYAVFAVCFLVIYAQDSLRHSHWRKEHEYQRLTTGTADQRTSAAAELVAVGAQEQLLRALQSNRKSVRDLAEASLWEIWFREGGTRAFHLLMDAQHSLENLQLAKALNTLDEVTTRYPRFAEGWNQRATLYWKLGNYAQAVADCQRVLALNPKHFGAWSGLGLCQLHLGEFQAACDSFHVVLKINPHDEAARQWLDQAQKSRHQPSKTNGKNGFWI